MAYVVLANRFFGKKSLIPISQILLSFFVLQLWSVKELKIKLIF